jgi:hypothetical protein
MKHGVYALDRLLLDLIKIAFGLLVLYLVIAAFYGYQVGRAIYEAKATNAVAAIASNVAGRELTEKYAIEQLQVPQVFMQAPSFWLALRLTE